MDVRVTFTLDGSGCMYDPNEPVHLDALLACVLADKYRTHHVTRDTIPDHIPLPLETIQAGGVTLWAASALVPSAAMGESLAFWRKRLRTDRIEVSKGSPNQKMGVYRDWSMPLHLRLCTELVAYARVVNSGGRGGGSQIRHILSSIRYLGRKRGHGWGRIQDIRVERTDDDYAITQDSLAMRWLPSASGSRMVRPEPPYWHPHGRVRCCEVGDPMPTSAP